MISIMVNKRIDPTDALYALLATYLVDYIGTIYNDLRKIIYKHVPSSFIIVGYDSFDLIGNIRNMLSYRSITTVTVDTNSISTMIIDMFERYD